MVPLTLLEVNRREHPRLHQHDFLPPLLQGDDFVAHLAVDVDLVLGQLPHTITTISISLPMSSSFSRSVSRWGMRPAVTRPRMRVPAPSLGAFSCLSEGAVLGDL